MSNDLIFYLVDDLSMEQPGDGSRATRKAMAPTYQAVTEAHEAGWAAYKQALANGLDDWEASVAYGEARRKIFTIFG